MAKKFPYVIMLLRRLVATCAPEDRDKYVRRFNDWNDDGDQFKQGEIQGRDYVPIFQKAVDLIKSMGDFKVKTVDM